MTQHVNNAVLIGRVIQSWPFGHDRVVRLQIRRPAFFPPRSDGPSDLVNVVLPEAIARGQVVSDGDELYVVGFIRNAEREVLLSSMVKDCALPQELQRTRVRQIVTEVVALSWQLVTDPPKK